MEGVLGAGTPVWTGHWFSERQSPPRGGGRRRGRPFPSSGCRPGRCRSAGLLVEGVGVAGTEHPAAEVLELRMGGDAFHQPDAESVAAMLFEDEDVGDVGEGSVVGDDARATGLSAVAVDADGERVFYRALDDVAREVLAGPVRGAEEGVDHVDVETRGVGGDGVVSARPFFVGASRLR